ncbi:MAG TPA: hypothetical protein VED40_21530 [Azospirillaceae bacterium]|nr:hypothetical protein [Azospirillaceae bacterium]
MVGLLSVLLPGWSAADERIRATLTVTLEREGDRPAFRIEGRLNRPTAAFHFDLPPALHDAVDWQVAEPGLRLAGAMLLRDDGRPLESFAILVRADRRRIDRQYPLAIAVGSRGLLLRPSFLAGDAAQFRTDITVTAGDGMRLIGRATHAAAALERPGPDQDARVAIVPAGEVRDEGFALFVTPADMDMGLRAEIVAQTRRVLSFYSERLGRAPAAPPAILLGLEELGRGGLRGDTSAGPMMVLRTGGSWAAFDPGQSGRLHRVIAHEAFHFWNAELIRPQGQPHHPWLHEGGAEYAALLALLHAGRMDGAQARSMLEDALDDCADQLGARALQAGGDAARGRTPYACGTALHWMADLALRRRGGGVLDVWREMIADGGADYGPDDFLRRAFPGEMPAAARIVLVGEGTERWAALPGALAGLGAEVAVGPPRPEKQTARMLMHLLQASCGKGPFGFWTRQGRLDLDTNESCGPLSGGPGIDRAEGHPLPAGAADAYAAASRKCAAGQPVSLGVAGSTRTIEAPCPKPLPAAPGTFRIVRGGPPFS